MAHLTNFSFEFFYEIFTEDASLLFLYHGAKKSKMTKNSNQGGSCLKLERLSSRSVSWPCWLFTILVSLSISLRNVFVNVGAGPSFEGGEGRGLKE